MLPLERTFWVQGLFVIRRQYGIVEKNKTEQDFDILSQKPETPFTSYLTGISLSLSILLQLEGWCKLLAPTWAHDKHFICKSYYH